MRVLIYVLILINLDFAAAHDRDYAQFVNPFIGSEGAIAGYACTFFSKRPS